MDQNQNKNILVFYYEDMLLNPKLYIKKLIKFLNIERKINEYNLNINDIIDNVLNKTSIKTMKNELSKSKNWSSVFGGEKFFRKGISGDYINHMSQELINEFDNITFLKFHGTDIKYSKKIRITH